MHAWSREDRWTWDYITYSWKSTSSTKPHPLSLQRTKTTGGIFHSSHSKKQISRGCLLFSFDCFYISRHVFDRHIFPVWDLSSSQCSPYVRSSWSQWELTNYFFIITPIKSDLFLFCWIFFTGVSGPFWVYYCCKRHKVQVSTHCFEIMFSQSCFLCFSFLA